MGKHAYLIMAHTQIELLKFLLKCIDYTDNDIFIHLDTKMGDIDQREISECCKYSKVYFTHRLNVIWGAFSQIECELTLLEEACSSHKYEYLHLLSGQDIPIKNQNYIHSFFEKFKGKEFVHYESIDLQGANYEKVALYFPFQHTIGGKKNVLYYIQRLLIRLQRQLKIDRIKNSRIKFAKGANWFSITGNFAEYILSERKWIYETFSKTLCCDEIFMQTLLLNSKYVNNLYYSGFDDNYEGNMRYIEWEKNTCNPKILTDLDLDKLLDSDKLFARKIQNPLNKESIQKLYGELTYE